MTPEQFDVSGELGPQTQSDSQSWAFPVDLACLLKRPGIRLPEASPVSELLTRYHFQRRDRERAADLPIDEGSKPGAKPAVGVYRSIHVLLNLEKSTIIC